MENTDTLYLLRECDAGTKMAVSSLDEVLEYTHADSLKDLLTESKAHHDKLDAEIHSLLQEYQTEEKDPSPMAKGMSWLKTNFKMSMDECDATIADLITDGCNMGIKSLYKYLNQYPTANHAVKDICNRLINIEEDLRKCLVSYL